MKPEKLRNLSWSTFKATIYCGIIGIVLVIAIPNPSYRDNSDVFVRVLANSGFGLVGIAVLTNFVSLISGSVAWVKGTKNCGWVIVSVILMLIPLAVIAASWLNI